MSRDARLFAGFVLLFLLVNLYLLGKGTVSADWHGLGVIVAAGFTLALYSFLYNDNPLFKFAQHVYVGVAAAYSFGQVWFPTLYGEILAPLLGHVPGQQASGWLLVPAVLGLLMLTRFSRRFGWLSRVSFAFYIGVGAGFTIPRYLSSYVLGQVAPTVAPLSWTWEGLDLLLILVGVVTVLIYFFFSVEHTGLVGRASRVGIWFLMISFGASFGYTVMARLSLLIGRMSFLLGDWLHLM